MKDLLVHLDWGLDTKGPHSYPADQVFWGLRIFSNVCKRSKLLLKMGSKLLPLAPISTIKKGKNYVIIKFHS